MSNLPRLEDISIHAWIQEYQIKTESGISLDFKDHPFMFDVYRDFRPKQVIMKAAQITATTCHIIKSFFVVKKLGLNTIYLLPTEDDIQKMVGSKVNPIIQQNPVLQEYTRDKDTIEQKQIGEHFIHFKGTWSEKAAIMVSSDLNIYDEVDASNQRVIEQYSTRLQHSPYKWEWYFSHPSAEGSGVDKYWQRSDQKHWFIRCSACNEWQFIQWPNSVDTTRSCFQCTKCHKELTDETRRKGKWVAKYPGREFSGYWIPLLICPWVSAKEIIGYFNNKSEEYFYNKVLGLPYVGTDNKLTKVNLMKNLTTEIITSEVTERVILGVDTGLKLDYVIWGEKGLFFNGEAEKYDELDALMKRWKKMIAFVDIGGDLIGSRDFQNRWRGRVFLVNLGGAKANSDEPVWNEDENIVGIDRNKYIQLVVSEFSKGRISLQGTENDWYDYWLDWNNLTRIKELDNNTGEFKGFKWIRSGRDHKALATVIARVGWTRFGGSMKIVNTDTIKIPQSYALNPTETVEFNPKTFFKYEDTDDWRRV
ncbi:MAG TPA: phage terminase large subunit family protein [Patescibacteria group bacterium]